MRGKGVKKREKSSKKKIKEKETRKNQGKEEKIGWRKKEKDGKKKRKCVKCLGQHSFVGNIVYSHNGFKYCSRFAGFETSKHKILIRC